MAIEIRIATDASDIHAIQRQRYEIYVDELLYPQQHACHAMRTIAEPIDDRAVLFGAFGDDGIVGSVRLTLPSLGGLVNAAECPAPWQSAHDDGFAEYTDLYGLHAFERWYPRGVCIVTKLMIAPAHRRGTLFAQLGLELYRYTRDTHPQIMFCVIDCVPHLQRYFLRLGYRRIGPPFEHPAAGRVLPMAFPLYDRCHFEAVRSPLAQVCPRHDPLTAEWFRQTFVDCRSCMPLESVES